jgi:CHAT domain-containing protein
VNEAVTLSHLGDAARLLGNPLKATRHHSDAIGLFESVQVTVVNDEAKAGYQAAMYNSYRALVSLLVERQRSDDSAHELPREAFELAEKGRARALLFMLSDSRTPLFDMAPSQLTQDRALRERIDATTLRLIEVKAVRSVDRDREQIDRLERDLSVLQDELERLEADFVGEHPAAANHLKLPSLALDDMERWLTSSDVTLLEYLLAPDESYLFTLGAAGLRLYILPPEERVRALVTELLSKVRNKEPDYQQLGEELFTVLIPPTLRDALGKQLLIAPDGILHYFPFEILLQGKLEEQTKGTFAGTTNSEAVKIQTGGTRYLVCEYAVRYVSSATAFFANVSSSGIATEYTKQFAGVAPVDFPNKGPGPGPGPEMSLYRGCAFNSLPHTEEEVGAICDLYGKEKSLGLLREAATKEALGQHDVLGARYLHIATHGAANENRPLFSGLLLSAGVNGESGFFSGFDILKLRVSAEMVVLSACDTGLGKLVQGEGLIGLTRSFLQAGAKSVVVSLWEVDDYATAELMKRFYTALEADDSLEKTEALRGAKESMIKNPPKATDDRDRTHPYYWAPFIFVG